MTCNSQLEWSNWIRERDQIQRDEWCTEVPHSIGVWSLKKGKQILIWCCIIPVMGESERDKNNHLRLTLIQIHPHQENYPWKYRHRSLFVSLAEYIVFKEKFCFLLQWYIIKLHIVNTNQGFPGYECKLYNVIEPDMTKQATFVLDCAICLPNLLQYFTFCLLWEVAYIFASVKIKS